MGTFSLYLQKRTQWLAISPNSASLHPLQECLGIRKATFSSIHPEFGDCSPTLDGLWLYLAILTACYLGYDRSTRSHKKESLYGFISSELFYGRFEIKGIIGSFKEREDFRYPCSFSIIFAISWCKTDPPFCNYGMSTFLSNWRSFFVTSFGWG